MSRTRSCPGCRSEIPSHFTTANCPTCIENRLLADPPPSMRPDAELEADLPNLTPQQRLARLQAREAHKSPRRRHR